MAILIRDTDPETVSPLLHAYPHHTAATLLYIQRIYETLSATRLIRGSMPFTMQSLWPSSAIQPGAWGVPAVCPLPGARGAMQPVAWAGDRPPWPAPPPQSRSGRSLPIAPRPPRGSGPSGPASARGVAAPRAPRSLAPRPRPPWAPRRDGSERP